MLIGVMVCEVVKRHLKTSNIRGVCLVCGGGGDERPDLEAATYKCSENLNIAMTGKDDGGNIICHIFTWTERPVSVLDKSTKWTIS